MTGGDKLAEKLHRKTKDHLRDYCTEAFRFYARWGSRDAYIKALIADLQRQKSGVNFSGVNFSGAGSPTEAALIRKEQVLREKAAEIADIDAAQMVMNVCEREVRMAVEMVYLDKPYEQLEWGDIKMRVHKASLMIPASERNVYRYLRRARMVFAEERGLRCKSWQ